MSTVTLVNAAISDSPFVGQATKSRLFVPPLESDEALVGKCYNNVQRMIRDRGGSACYGWALTDFGPHQAGGVKKEPLYRRWINHVVWRDAAGLLWEVSPNTIIDSDTPQKLFMPTEFLPEPEATFEVISETEWLARATRYIPTRPEGFAVAELLAQAQHAMNDDIRTYWLRKALASLADAGFTPKEWRVETIGNRTGSIWLIAE
jgi:hypothetical protein